MNLMSSVKYGKFVEAKNIPDYEYRYLRNKYDEFLEQPLEIWQFVPCKLVDGVWVVLEKPQTEFKSLKGSVGDDSLKEYEQAKSLCLFEGLRIEKDTYKQTKRTFYFIKDKRVAHVLEFHSGEIETRFDLKYDYKTIEDLTYFNLELTANTIKNLGL